MRPGGNPAFPIPHENGDTRLGNEGLTKREYFAGIAMHAEFLSCGMNTIAAMDLAETAKKAGQSVEQRIAVNALTVADALLAELAK